MSCRIRGQSYRANGASIAKTTFSVFGTVEKMVEKFDKSFGYSWLGRDIDLVKHSQKKTGKN